MHIETSNPEASALLTKDHIRQRVGVQHRDKIEMLSHDINNCVASIETADDMLRLPDLSIEDRSSLQELKRQAARELAQVIKDSAPSLALFVWRKAHRRNAPAGIQNDSN